MKNIPKSLKICLILLLINFFLCLSFTGGSFEFPFLYYLTPGTRQEFDPDAYTFSSKEIRLTDYIYQSYHYFLMDGYTYMQDLYGRCYIIGPDGSTVSDAALYTLNDVHCFDPSIHEAQINAYPSSWTGYTPQYPSGNIFEACPISTGGEVLLNSEGNLITDRTYRTLTPISEYHCKFIDGDESGVIYTPTGKEVVRGKNPIIWESYNDSPLFASVIADDEDGGLYTISFICGTEVYETITCRCEGRSVHNYFEECIEKNTPIYDSYGNKFFPDIFCTKTPSRTYIYNYSDMAEQNNKTLILSPRVDKSYYLKPALVNGNVRYALYKMLDEGRTKEEFLAEARERTKFTVPEIPSLQEISETHNNTSDDN